MHWLDIALLAVLVVATFMGFKQGLIKAVLTLAGWIIGVILASNFYGQLAKVLSFIDNEQIANIVAYIIILAVVMVAAAILARVLKAIIKLVLLGWVDHVGGAAFGLIMGLILLGAVLAAIGVVFDPPPAVLQESLISKFLLDQFPVILGLLPGEFDIIKDFFVH